ncbi:MAG TPA: hypothetical protein VJ963_01935 [Bacteroidales bacterium]|nr:hypothetical protein [Bacteroidales bacterium]
MKILIAFKYSVLRTLKIWKAVLLIWFSSLLTAGMIGIPLKRALKAGFSNSTITERLAHGIRPEVFSDLGPVLKSMMSYISGGLLFAILVWFLLNVVFTGGLFHSLSKTENKFMIRNFLGDSAKKFWSFLVINIIMSLITAVVVFIIIVLPVNIITSSGTPDEGVLIKTVRILVLVFLVILPLLLLAADYARAWQAAHSKNECFRAIGFGFGNTFRTLFISWTAMVAILIVQVLFGWLVLSILPAYIPEKGGGVFLLFLLSQFLFFVKIMLKVWRYGSVTSLMEQKKAKAG